MNKDGGIRMTMKIPLMYAIYASFVLLVNLFGYYIPLVQNNLTMETFYIIVLPFQLSVLVWFCWLIYRNAPLNENIPVFMVVYFFLQAPFIFSYGLRGVNQLYDFIDMTSMVIIGFSLAALFVMGIVDIWPSYISLTVFVLLMLRFLNLSWMQLFDLYYVSKEAVVGTIVYSILAIGVIFVEAFTLYRFYELEE